MPSHCTTFSRISHSWLKHLNKICMPVSSASGDGALCKQGGSLKVLGLPQNSCHENLKTQITPWSQLDWGIELQPQKCFYIVDLDFRYISGNAAWQLTFSSYISQAQPFASQQGYLHDLWRHIHTLVVNSRELSIPVGSRGENTGCSKTRLKKFT